MYGRPSSAGLSLFPTPFSFLETDRKQTNCFMAASGGIMSNDGNSPLSDSDRNVERRAPPAPPSSRRQRKPRTDHVMSDPRGMDSEEFRLQRVLDDEAAQNS
jgi:hypothetical protein